MSAHATPAELEAGLNTVREAPTDRGTLELVVVRPEVGEREVLDEATLDLDDGVVGDRWRSAGRSGGRPANVNAQVTLMSARAAALVAGDRERWPLAGDQLYVDLDLSGENLPPGTRLGIGSAVVEVTVEPHTGCKKFTERFGLDAMVFVNSPEGRALNLRGINTRVVEAGTVRVGDIVSKV
jgi:MOSC domain-containing protein YiiM